MDDVALNELTPGATRPLRLSPSNIETNERDPEDATATEDIRIVAAEEAFTLETKVKLVSAILAFFVAGINDGSLGALISYMLQTYHIGTGSIAILYATSFAGWVIAAFIGGFARLRLGLGGTLALGAALQIVAQALRIWHAPFALFAVTFFLAALGQALQDAQASTFVSAVHNAHRWLGGVHASYGFGCLVGPLVAAVIASKSHQNWNLFYSFPLGMGVANITLALWAFRHDITQHFRHRTEQQASSDPRSARVAWMEIKRSMHEPAVWLLSAFYFFYLGVAVTSGGWLVQYLVTVRGDQLSKVDYIPSGYYGGVALGRLLLAEPTYRLGERRMLLLYTILCLGLQVAFWQIRGSMIASGVIVSMMGFLLAPFFATGISVSTKLLPKELHTSALGLIFVTAQAGGNAFPAITGVIAAKAGVGVLQPILVGLIVALGISWALVPRVKQRAV